MTEQGLALVVLDCDGVLVDSDVISLTLQAAVHARFGTERRPVPSRRPVSGRLADVSYDVLLLPRRPDQTWQDALDEAEQRSGAEEPLSPERLGQWAEITRRLADHLPAARQHVGTSSASLEDRATGLQVHLYAHEAAVNHPHGDASDETVLRLAGEAVAVLVEVTGLQAYDRQSDDDYLPLPGAAGSAGRAKRPAKPTSTPPTPKGPQPQDRAVRAAQFRGWRFLVLGLLLIVSSGLILTRPDPPALVWGVLAIGLVDAAIGARALLALRRR